MRFDNLRIGELAKRTNSTVETIRYYEREGLLPAPSRTDSNYRMYGANHLERLSLIRHCRSLDIGLEEIRTLLKFRDAPEENCEDVNALLDTHISHVTARVADLRELEKHLKGLRRLCNATNKAKHCAILKDLTAEATATTCGKSRRTK
ncbi:Cd(II)/Pb(II)-responsive transcriptional regulator [Herminiimonas aquatilis]|uniref:Cd(II)/Pb(II)-responsive transcriptional regulator n=1 Tax=Herminiimonas aquatilis TaxID=345342 RepID=A0ABW2J6L0_9BURK